MSDAPSEPAPSDTKQCPYCAETIKAAAIVCRYCGRDLVLQPAPAPVSQGDLPPRYSDTAAQKPSITGQPAIPSKYGPPVFEKKPSKLGGCLKIVGVAILIILGLGFLNAFVRGFSNTVTITSSGASTAPLEDSTTEAPSQSLTTGMSAVDNLGMTYTLKAPVGLQLDEWAAKPTDDGGAEYWFKVSTPGRKFDGDLKANVSFVDENGAKVASDGVYMLGSKAGQDRATRSYSNSVECRWNNCAGVLDKAETYTVTFDVELVDFE